MKRFKKSLIVLTIILLSASPVFAQQTNYPLSRTSLVTSGNTSTAPTALNTTTATIQAIENQIKSLDAQIGNAKSSLTNAEQKLLEVYTKHPYCLISGDIISYSPDFIVIGSAIGDNMFLSDNYIQVLNPSDKSKMLSIFSEQRYFIKWTKNKKGVSIAVFGAAPKELLDAKTSYEKVKANYDSLVKQKNDAIIKKEDALAQQAGSSVVYYENGDKYIGKMKDGKRDGKGKMFLSNGDYYEGDFKEDLYNGLGTLKTGYRPADDLFEARFINEYVGGFKYGLYNGKGTLKFNRNGYRYFIYTGSFKDGFKDGYGEIRHSMVDSIDYKGNFKYDVYLGPTEDNSKEVYLDGRSGYSMRYPADWGTPKTEKNDSKGSWGMVTTFLKNDNVHIFSFGDTISGTLEEYAIRKGLGHGYKTLTMFEYRGFLYENPSAEYSSADYYSKVFIIVDENNLAFCFELKYKRDMSWEEMDNYKEIFEDMIESIVPITAPVG